MTPGDIIVFLLAWLEIWYWLIIVVLLIVAAAVWVGWLLGSGNTRRLR